MADCVLWTYGVMPGRQSAPAGVEGLEGRPVAALRHRDLAVLVTELPADPFTGAELDRRLEDLPTLGRLAREHDAVLEAALMAGDVVPFRMCTLFRTARAVHDMLDVEYPRLTAALARLRGTAEWGVKAYAVPHAGDAPAPRPASGIEYLARRRAQRDAAEATRDAVESAAAEIHAELAQRAINAALGSPQDRRLSGRDDEMVLNGAYLVARDAAPGFAAIVERLRGRYADDGVSLELTGPWPPYHFVGAPSS